jgi:hypothetical protein
MKPSDTSPEAAALLVELYRQMTPGQKLLRVFEAYRAGKALAMAGLAMRYPEASAGQLDLLWKRQHLGPELFTEVYGQHIAQQIPE